MKNFETIKRLLKSNNKEDKKIGIELILALSDIETVTFFQTYGKSYGQGMLEIEDFHSHGKLLPDGTYIRINSEWLLCQSAYSLRLRKEGSTGQGRDWKIMSKSELL